MPFFHATEVLKDEVITSELFFSEFRIGSYHNQPDSVKEWFESALDTLDVAHADSTTLNLIEAYHALESEGLLYKPFVDLKREDNCYVKLYLDSADYDRIKIYKWRQLRDDGKKVMVKARAVQISNSTGVSLRYCVDLMEVVVKEGETLPSRSKFRIEDYN